MLWVKTSSKLRLSPYATIDYEGGAKAPHVVVVIWFRRKNGAPARRFSLKSRFYSSERGVFFLKENVRYAEIITGFCMLTGHTSPGRCAGTNELRPITPSLRGSRGAALLEFAVVVPLLIFVCLWVGSLGFAISQLVWLSEASYAAVVAGAEERSTSVATTEGFVDELFTSRHGRGLEGPIVLSNREAEVRNDLGTDDSGPSGQAPLISLTVALESRPLLGFLPVLDLGLTTVVSRLTVGGDPGDLSEPGNIESACSGEWQLPCGSCGGVCHPNGGNPGGGNPGGTKGNGAVVSEQVEPIPPGLSPGGWSTDATDPPDNLDPIPSGHSGKGGGNTGYEAAPINVVPPLPGETEQNWY
jgi:hypothetical protein